MKLKIVYLISGISALICLISSCVVFYRDGSHLGFDYIGLNVSILAFITMFLLGFQIYNTISVDDRIKKEATDLATKVISEYNSNFESLFSVLLHKGNINNEPDYIDALFKSANKAADEASTHSEVLPLFFIETIIKSKGEEFLVIRSGMKKSYRNIVSKSKYRNKQTIIDAINNAEEVQET